MAIRPALVDGSDRCLHPGRRCLPAAPTGGSGIPGEATATSRGEAFGLRFVGLIAAVALSVVASMIATAGGTTTVPATDGAAADTEPAPDAAPAADAEPVTADRISRDPTAVGEPVGDRRAPTPVQVELETTEVTGQLADGTAYDYWTFDGTVPGPMIRARVGDTIEMTCRNSPEATNTHSIDLHAVNGPGGGAVVTQVAPGEAKTFSFDQGAAEANTHVQTTPIPAGEYAPGDRVPVSMTEFAYEPSELELTAGTYTFAITNEGAAPTSRCSAKPAPTATTSR